MVPDIRLESLTYDRASRCAGALSVVAHPPQFRDYLVQAAAPDQLHGVVADLGVLADLEEGHDIGVMELGGGAGLAAEALDGRGAHGVPRQDLERHAPAQRYLLGLIDDPHPPAADLAVDPVVADLAQRRRGCAGCDGPGPVAWGNSASAKCNLDHRGK